MRQATLARGVTYRLFSTQSAPIGLETYTKQLIDGIAAGHRTSLSRAITLGMRGLCSPCIPHASDLAISLASAVESSKESHQIQAQLLLDHVLGSRERVSLPELPAVADPSLHDPAQAYEDLLSHQGVTSADAPSTSFRVGIAGPPGAGKSTFIESLGSQLCAAGFKVAVVAVDPSSTRTGGSILGDKTRMTELSRNPNAFVRPAPTRGALGGVAEHTNDVVLLTEAAGYDVVLVETVGLGQSEVAVDATVDMLTLVVPPAGGDELQGVKKGIMEVADLVVVNKADGHFAHAARHAAAEVRRALQLVRRKHKDWKPTAVRCSALEGSGVDAVWGHMSDFWRVAVASGRLHAKRQTQAMEWARANAISKVLMALEKSSAAQHATQEVAPALGAGTMTPRAAGRAIATAFLSEPRA